MKRKLGGGGGGGGVVGICRLRGFGLVLGFRGLGLEIYSAG